MQALELVQKLDTDQLKQLPANAPTSFVPRELRRALIDETGNLNRNAWEMGLALAIKDALRSGDLYLPQSKQHVSFWDFMLSEPQWEAAKTSAYAELKQLWAGLSKLNTSFAISPIPNCVEPSNDNSTKVNIATSRPVVFSLLTKVNLPRGITKKL